MPLVLSISQQNRINGVDLRGRWSETDIAPTVLGLLGISGNISAEGRALPIKETYSLRVVGAPGTVALLRGGKPVTNASGDEAHNFQGLARGIYTIEAGGVEQEVVVNGDQTLDLAGRGAVPADWRKILGVILIFAINLG